MGKIVRWFRPPPVRRERCTIENIMNLISRAFLAPFALAAIASGQRLALHYNQPAEDWQSQALPIGNGRLGAMIFGDARHEHLQLNEISLWTGDEKDTGSYQNLGDLWLDLTHGAPQAYERRLDIDTAIQQIAYSADGIAYRREYLASAPQQVLVLRYTADKPGAYNGTLKLSDAHSARTTAAGNLLTAGGKLANGLQYETEVQLVSSGGHVTATADGVLHIEKADSLTHLRGSGHQLSGGSRARVARRCAARTDGRATAGRRGKALRRVCARRTWPITRRFSAACHLIWA